MTVGQWMKLIPEGKVYDKTGEGVKEHIQSFIEAYDLPMDELLVQDLDQYPVGITVAPLASAHKTDFQRVLLAPPEALRPTDHCAREPLDYCFPCRLSLDGLLFR